MCLCVPTFAYVEMNYTGLLSAEPATQRLRHIVDKVLDLSQCCERNTVSTSTFLITWEVQYSPVADVLLLHLPKP